MRKLLLATLLFAVSAQADPGIAIPTYPREALGGGGIQAITLNQSTDSYQCIIRCNESCSITEIGQTYGARTGTPVVHRASIQGVSTTTGQADGTVKNSGGSSVTYTPPASAADDGLFKWRTLGTPYSCTTGELMAFVQEDDPVDGGAPDVSNSSSFPWEYAGWGAMRFPYSVSVDNGTPTKRSDYPMCAYRCSDNSVVGLPFNGRVTRTYHGDAATDEYGIRFNLSNLCSSTADICGMRLWLGGSSSSVTATFSLYSGTTSLVSVVRDVDQMTTGSAWAEIPFDTSYEVSCTSDYRLAVLAGGTGGTVVGLDGVTVTSNDDLSAFPLGISTYGTYRVNAGAWTDVNTEIIHIEPMLCGITGGSASAPGTKLNKGFN